MARTQGNQAVMDELRSLKTRLTKITPKGGPEKESDVAETNDARLGSVGTSDPFLKMGRRIKVWIHRGTMDCDQVFACALLKHAKPESSTIEFLRSSENVVTKKMKNSDIVVGVGGVFDPSRNRYDHHQRSFDHTMNSLNKDYPWTTKLSSAGLVYFYFGHKSISRILKIPKDSENTKIVFAKVYENFVQEIDAIANGIDPCGSSEVECNIHTNLSERVKRLNPAWKKGFLIQDESECFKKALAMVYKELWSTVEYYGEIWLPSRDTVERAILRRKSVDVSGEIIDLISGDCPWKEHLFELEESLILKGTIKYVVYPSRHNDYRVECVPISPFSFETRLPLKEEWHGLRDEELSQVSGIPGCIFVHSSGNTGSNKTRDGALQMALESRAANGLSGVKKRKNSNPVKNKKMKIS